MRLGLGSLGASDFFDVCVVGAGPAGTVVTDRLAAAGRRVCLLEGGGLDYSAWSQALYQGEVIGDPYFALDVARLRYLGGSSNHWGGMCRPLDAADFLPKLGRAEMGWPIRRADLDPYLATAHAILGVEDLLPDMPVPGSSRLRRVDFKFTDPLRFGEAYRARLVDGANIFLVVDGNVTGLETDGRRVTGARAVDRTGVERVVRARAFVLATGGIENSRLLLWANAQSNGQLVKDARTLGRYWMEHPHYTLGDAVLLGNGAQLIEPRKRIGFYAPRTGAVWDEAVLNFCLRLHVPGLEPTERLIADLACVAPEWARWASRRFVGKELSCTGAFLRAAWEQEPRAANRIELGTERDALGMPRVRLHWRKSTLDLRTARTAAQRMAAFLARTEQGRLRLQPWVLGEGEPPADDELAGFHHMGGTRMAATAADGVVDGDGKVFGQANLYVTGSSVFPSSGYANPTVTIVQLALRLADHLQATSGDPQDS